MTNSKVAFDHSVIAVSNVSISDAFYEQVIGVEIVRLGKHYRCYRLGNQQLNVHSDALKNDPDTKSLMIYAEKPVEPGNSDLCFAWNGPIEEAIAHLEAHNVKIIAGPRPSFGGAGHGTSIYFRDPDGSLMEFISYA
jgi:catechol 2,3-dioxygenase-like lactoylglutathione lyase family enzyme